MALGESSRLGDRMVEQKFSPSNVGRAADRVKESGDVDADALAEAEKDEEARSRQVTPDEQAAFLAMHRKKGDGDGTDG